MKILMHLHYRSRQYHQQVGFPTTLLIILISLLFLSGCIPQVTISPTTADPSSHTSSPSADTPDSTPSPSVPAPSESSIDRTARPTPEKIDQLERLTPSQETPVLGEVPTILLDEIIADLAERLDVDPEEVNVLRAQAVVWNDGSLGCPKPGQFYTQALVDGYQVVLSVADRDYDYRASQRGYFFLCEPVLHLTPP